MAVEGQAAEWQYGHVGEDDDVQTLVAKSRLLRLGFDGVDIVGVDGSLRRTRDTRKRIGVEPAASTADSSRVRWLDKDILLPPQRPRIHSNLRTLK